MSLNKIQKFLSYWKQIIIISIGCIAFFIIADFLPYQGNTESPWWNTYTLTGSEYMAIHWPIPKPNDPNFLKDYQEFMGYEWKDPQDYNSW